jgi:glycosyltransferase involved in cell wall biosynthesis
VYDCWRHHLSWIDAVDSACNAPITPGFIKGRVLAQKQPFFSIIIPTYNRPRQLAACLQALARLDYPCDRFEVIVVDDGSETLPETVVDAFCERLDVTLLTQPNAGPAAARNTGAERAKGEFLAFTDDDCVPVSNWLQALASRFSKAPDCAIGGRTLNALLANPYSTTSQVLIDYLYTYYNADPEEAQFFTSNNLALPTDRFHTMGGFDTTFPLAGGEDRDFCDRWLYNGLRMISASEVIVYHSHALTSDTFWRQHFNYGRGAFHYRQIRAQRCQGTVKVEPLSFYLNLLRYPFLQREQRKSPCQRHELMIGVLSMISQVANAAGFFWEKLNRTRNRVSK